MSDSRDPTFLTTIHTEYPNFKQMFVRIHPTAKVTNIEYILDDQIVMLMPNNETPLSDEMEQVYNQLKSELTSYFSGELSEFTIPTYLQGTQFQKLVWEQIQRIPNGQTITYLELTLQCGLSQQTIRAVAHAVGQNPIPILIPCHRVIGSNGKLIGYRGGLERKRALLKIEKVILF